MRTTRPDIPKELVADTHRWLGKDGIAFFKGMKEKYGKYSPVFLEGGIPHPVHWREGMSVRNFMRNSGLCDDWSDHDFDNYWVELIELVMEYEVLTSILP